MSSNKKTEKNFSIIYLLFLMLLLLNVISISTIGVLWYKTTRDINNNYIHTINTSYIRGAKQYAKFTIKNLVRLIDKDKNQLIPNIKHNVEHHSVIFKFFADLYSAYNGVLTKDKARLLMERYLTHLTFSSIGRSYYVFDTKGHCIVNPFCIGISSKNLIGLKDFKGNLIIRDIIKTAKTKKEAFINQYWPSNWYDLRSKKINMPGITFVRFNKEFNWIFVTRINPDVLMSNLQNKWIKELSTYRYGKNGHGYIFVAHLLNINGGKCFAREIVNPNRKNIVGKCLSDNVTDIMGNYFRKNYLMELKRYGNAFSTYYYKQPGAVQQKKKVAYMELYKPWNWIIGTGIYTKDLQPIINIAKGKAETRMESIMKIIALVIVVAVLFSILLYIFLIKVLQKSTDKVLEDLETSLLKVIYIDKNKYRIKEIKRVVNSFNISIKKFKLYEEEFIKSFINFMEARDIYTKGHSQRVAYYAKNIAVELGLDEKTQDNIYKAGLLHDIGKMGIPDNILLKPGKLTENEYHIMKYHPVLSYEMLKGLEHFKGLCACVRSHHEKCDGSGYPDNLICEKIPLGAKILAIADIFDALTTTRPYRHAFSVEEAIEILRKEKVDQEILSKVKNKLLEIYIQENDVEITFMPKEIDTLRNNIFNVDYMTGLRYRAVFLQDVQSLINRDVKFVFTRINIKNISNINYIFSPQIGDEIIMCTAKALMSISEKTEMCDINLMSRAYGDIFYAVHKLPNNVDSETRQKMSNFAREKLLKAFLEILSDSPISKLRDSKGKTIIEYIDFHLTYAIYPDDATTISKLIHLCEKN